MPIDYEIAKELLENEFIVVEANVLSEHSPSLSNHVDKIFRSQTQAYREVLLGCVLVRILDKSIDVHKPYVNQGDDAYNGRTLDERVINPFLSNMTV